MICKGWFFWYCSAPQNQDLIWEEEINTFTVPEKELFQWNISQIGHNKREPYKHSRCKNGGRTAVLHGTFSCLRVKIQAVPHGLFFACLKTFRGYPIHQLHVFVMTLFCLFLQTQGEFLKANPAMFRVTVSRASVWVWAQMSAGMNISALLKPWSCWFRHIPLVYWWQAGYEGPLGEDQLQEHSTCKFTQIKSDVLKNPFRYDIISPNPVPVHHGSERRKRW